MLGSRRMKVVVVAALVCVSSSATAKNLVPSEGPQDAPVAAPREAPLRGIEARQEVSASGRGLVTPTAITVPAGGVEVSLQSVVPLGGILGLVAGITGTTEVWAEGAAVILEDQAGAYGAGIKQSLLRTQHIAIAATGSARMLTDDGKSEPLYAVGAVATVCVDDACAVEVSGSYARVWGYTDDHYDDSGPRHHLVTGSVSLGNTTTRFLVEGMWLGGEGAGLLGMRFGTKKYAVDLAIARPIVDEFDDDIPGLPWIGFTARP